MLLLLLELKLGAKILAIKGTLYINLLNNILLSFNRFAVMPIIHYVQIANHYIAQISLLRSLFTG